MFPIGVSCLRIVFDDEIVSFDLTAALGRFGDRFDVQSGERRKAASEVFMKFRLGCELAYKVVAETVFIFNVQVAFLQRHIDLVDQLNFNPNLPRRFYTVPDLRNRYTQVVAPVGDLSLSYTAEVDLDIFRADPATVHEMDVRGLPLDILPYLLPSRFVPSDRLANFALREFAGFPRGDLRVSMICGWIYQNIEYRRGSSDAQTTAIEILVQRAGVCRDFAHLGIAFPDYAVASA